LAACSKEVPAFPKQFQWIVGMLYDVIQGYRVKRHFREPNILQSVQLDFQSKSLARICYRRGINVLTVNIPPERPQSGEPNSIAATDIKQLARLNFV